MWMVRIASGKKGRGGGWLATGPIKSLLVGRTALVAEAVPCVLNTRGPVGELRYHCSRR